MSIWRDVIYKGHLSFYSNFFCPKICLKFLNIFGHFLRILDNFTNFSWNFCATFKIIFSVGISDELEDSTDSEGQNAVWRGWYKFDRAFMKPILTHRGPPLVQSCPSFCHRLAHCFTSQEAYSSNHNGNDDQEVILSENLKRPFFARTHFCTKNLVIW